MNGFAIVADAAGPEQIRAGFAAALTTTDEHTGHIDGLARVLADAADWYESLQMAGTTIAHLRDAATALTAGSGQLSAASERLQAAAADFEARDGQVAQAVADAGNLMDAAGYAETFSITGTPTGGTDMSFPTDETVTEAVTASSSSTDPDAPGDGDGLPDAAGLAENSSEHWHGSDVVTAGSGDGKVSLGLCQYPHSDAYVVVATNPAAEPWDPDSDGNGVDPALSKEEAGQLADALDELVGLAESGAQTTAPTKLEKVAARVRELSGDSGVTIVGDEGEIEVSAADIRKLLDAAAPKPAVATRRKVAAKACLKDNMDTGAVWAQLDTSGAEPVVAVTSTEGEPPEDYPEGYTTTRLSPAEAAELAAKVRRFAQADPTSAAGESKSDDAGPVGPVDSYDHAALRKSQTAVEVAGYTVSPKQLTALHGLYQNLVRYRNGAPTVYGVNVRRQLDTLADKGIIARTGMNAYMIPYGSPGEQIVAAMPDLSVGAHLSNPRGAEAEKGHSDPEAPVPATGAGPEQPTPVAAPAVPAGPHQIASPRGRTYEYDPATGATAVIEPDGWRAVVPPSSSTGAAARLLWWNAEIRDGRGDDATDTAARALLGRLSAAELREVADEIGSSARGARTRPQLIDTIVTLAISHARNSRALRQL